jgi:hypothetical protein
VARPTDYASVVRANHTKTIGYIFAVTGECIGIRDDEIARIRRKLVAVSAEGLAAIQTKGSWLLGVILCAGDDTRSVAGWLAKLALPARPRIRFYAHPEVDLRRAFAAWVEADLGEPRVQTVTDFSTFHRQFGVDLNDVVYADALGGGR